eukprot:5579525-Ditylum_brightwellii.AAC.1
MKRTLGYITQLAMRSLAHISSRQHHKSRTLQRNVPRVAETFATDTLFSSQPGLGGDNGAPYTLRGDNAKMQTG